MKSGDLSCWKCGATLADILLPFSRLAKCKACNADLHVCRMCRFYDTSMSNSCSEPVAEKVNDKQRKNFCGYFQPDPDAYKPPDTSKSDSARAALDAMFGLDVGPGEEKKSPEENARRRLEDLFNLKQDRD